LPSPRLCNATILSHTAAGRQYYRLVLKIPGTVSLPLPGQFVMLRVTDTIDPLLARPFGISSVLTRTSIEIFYRVVGRGTMLLSRTRPGRTLDMLGPLGRGFPMPEKGIQPILVTGGSGFPPLHLLAKALKKQKYRSVIFIGARDRSELPPAGILRSFKEQASALHITTEDGSAGKKGLITDLFAPYCSLPDRSVKAKIYACGPTPMLKSVSTVAAECSIPCFVSMEERMACGLGACMGCSVRRRAGGYLRVCKEGPVFEAEEIAW